MTYGFTDIIALFGSLGLFLYGMKTMSDALMEVAGNRMRRILSTLTSNRALAVFTGFLITAVIQSSSATTLMVVSFVNASLLTLGQAIGVILGANIGTTVTAWLVTLLGIKVNISSIALPLVGVGFLFTFSKKERLKRWGKFIVGFALLFIGLEFLKSSLPDLKANPEVLAFLESYTSMGIFSVLLFLFIGTALTLLVQSSSATMALTLIMCNEGWIPFDMAAAMVLGENVGTTITANLAAVVANYEAKRAARAHFVSQIIGVVVVLIFFYPFLNLVDYLTMTGGASAFDTATAIPVALSAFHTSFNVLNALVLIWFIGLISVFVSKMVPAVEGEEPDIDQPKYLTETALKYRQTAMRAMVDETKRLFEGPCFEIIAHALNLHREDIKSHKKLKRVIRSSKEELKVDIDELYYTKVKAIYSRIIEFGTRIQSKFALSEENVQDIYQIKVANRYMVEAIKDSRGLDASLSKYMYSGNKHVEREYDLLRSKISKVLRRIYRLRKADNPLEHLEKLQRLKESAKLSDLLVDGRLDDLIRKNLITSEMATSLANDSGNVAGISRNLIRVAELLYIHSDTMLADIKDVQHEDRQLPAGDKEGAAPMN